jgi:hypothetical protein
VLAAPPQEPGWVRWRRAAVAVVAAVLVLTGAASIVAQVLRWVAPTAAPPPAVAVTDAAFEAVAVPFAVDYLSWDAAARSARQTALTRSAAPDTTVDGWGGSGRQWADSPTAVGIARADAEHAVVTVRVRVTPSTAATTPPLTAGNSPPAASPSTSPPTPPATTSSSGPVSDGGPNVASGPPPAAAGWTAWAPRWVNLAVPVARRDGRIVVTAPPVLVGSAQPSAARPAVPGGSTAEDAAFAGQTREVITTLLRAYGSGELDYARASGTSFTGLDKAAALQEVTAWRVQQNPGGDGSVRVGDVTVTWVLSGGAGTLRCTYRVELRGDGGRWYLASIGAGTEAVT